MATMSWEITKREITKELVPVVLGWSGTSKVIRIICWIGWISRSGWNQKKDPLIGMRGSVQEKP